MYFGVCLRDMQRGHAGSAIGTLMMHRHRRLIVAHPRVGPRQPSGRQVGIVHNGCFDSNSDLIYPHAGQRRAPNVSWRLGRWRSALTRPAPCWRMLQTASSYWRMSHRCSQDTLPRSTPGDPKCADGRSPRRGVSSLRLRRSAR